MKSNYKDQREMIIRNAAQILAGMVANPNTINKLKEENDFYRIAVHAALRLEHELAQIEKEHDEEYNGTKN